METFIVKRDGTREAFSMEKIQRAIAKAFLSVGSFATQDVITNILSRVSVTDGISVEEIQNQVEVALMAERYYTVAKAYMLYRQRHTEDREVRDKLQFLMEYCDASNAATGSKFDANANVENKNMATLIGELPKSNFIRLNRRMLTDRLKEMYGKELADKYIEMLNDHFIYKNDETSLANYCASITMYPWLIGGTISIGGNSKAPTNLKSFCGGFVNMVFIVSSMLSGACATPEFLMYMNYFIGQEYGTDYFKRADEVVDLSKKRRTIDKVITDCFEQIVYSINQPTGARNFQAVFWNVAYYDRYYFESLFGNFLFPDGSKPDWESLSWLQKRFMKWFNRERTRTVLTFPVETMALLTENGDVKDKEWGDFTAEMYAEGHSFFTYMSDNADSLSSCCRLRNSLKDLEDKEDSAHNHTTHQYSMGTASVATGDTWIMAAVMIGGMVPPIAIALSTTFNKKKWTKEELKSGPVNYAMGLCFITEGAIPYAASDPLRVIPSCMVGSAVAGLVCALFGCACPAPHGGVFTFAVVDHPLGYIVALVAGSVVGALMLALLKKNKTEKERA